jgi:hypothetical protein
LTESEQAIYESTLADYLAMFAEMEPKQRAAWFFVAEESSLLSFPVSPDQTPQEASAEHSVRLLAIADALAAQPPDKGDKAMVDDLRQLAQLHQT